MVCSFLVIVFCFNPPATTLLQQLCCGSLGARLAQGAQRLVKASVVSQPSLAKVDELVLEIWE